MVLSTLRFHCLMNLGRGRKGGGGAMVLSTFRVNCIMSH